MLELGIKRKPEDTSIVLSVVFSLTLAFLYQLPLQAQLAHRPIKPWIQEILDGDGASFYEGPAVKAITERGAKALFDELIPLLQHSDNQIRYRSATILRYLQRSHGQKLPDDVLHGLLQCLTDSEYVVRQSAAGAIATFGERAVPILIERLDNKNRIVRYWSVWALGEIGPPAKEAVTSLIETYRTSKSPQIYPFSHTGRHNETDIHRCALLALGKIWVDADTVPLFPIEQFEIEPHAAKNILAMVGEQAVPFLNRQLENENIQHRLAALDALFRIPDTDASLYSALKNSEAKVRYSAAFRLGWRQHRARRGATFATTAKR